MIGAQRGCVQLARQHATELPNARRSEVERPWLRFRQSAMTSFTVSRSVEGCTTRMFGVEATRLTGTKSATDRKAGS